MMKRKIVPFLLAATLVTSVFSASALATPDSQPSAVETASCAVPEAAAERPADTTPEAVTGEPVGTVPEETRGATAKNALAAVYLDGVQGADINDAATPDNAVRSIAKALELVADGGTVFIVDSVRLVDAGEVTLDGGARNITFTRASESTHAHVLFYLEGNTTFTMRNVKVDAAGRGSCVKVKNGATFTIQGGTKITGAQFGAVDASTDPGRAPTTLNMTGGEISNNQNNSTQGSVCVGEKCVFNLSGGVIANNSGTDAGGVFVTFPVSNSGGFVGGKFYMTGGTIANNTSGNCGGGVQNYGYCELTGGSIKNNNADWGGGVATCGVATTVIDGVEITGNKCNGNGAGVYVEGFNPNGNPSGVVTGKATVTMRSGSITNNVSVRGSGGGIYGWAYQYPTTIEVSGGTISGNTINEHGIGTAIALSGHRDYDYCKLKLSGSPAIQGEVFMRDDLFSEIKVDVVGDFSPTNPVVLEDTSWTNFRTVVEYKDGLTRDVNHFTTIEPVPPRDVMPDKDDTQKILSINKLTVEFYSDNDLKGSIYVVPSTTIDAGEVPQVTKAGYALTGWALRDGTKWDMATDTVTQNATKLYAQWEKMPTYTVAYTDGVDSEEVFADQVYTDVLSGAATPAFKGETVRKGYKFTGWSPAIADTVAASVTYVAQWEADNSDVAHYYDLIFETNGGSTIPTQRLQGYATVQLTQVPSKAGYTFEGWYADKDLTERILSVHMDRDKTVYARWTKEPVQPPADPPKPSEPSEPTNPTRPDESPKTGDPSMAGAWMIWSISLGLGLVLCSQRRKHSK